MTYRVRNWADGYENKDSRKLKALLWVKVPNRMDSDGYITLVSHSNGAAHLGVWLAVLEIASTCDPRGTLVRARGGPHTVETLAAKCRLPMDLIYEALPRLLDIGWLEVVQDKESPASPGNDRDLIPVDREITGKSPGIEEGRKEGRNEGKGHDSRLTAKERFEQAQRQRDGADRS